MALRGTRSWGRHTRSVKGRERRPSLLVELLEERALPSFLPPMLSDLTMPPWAVATGDFNGDGLTDLVTANGSCCSNGVVNVLLATKDGSFEPPQSFPAGFSPSDVAVLDLDNDGALDLAVANDRTVNGTVTVLWGNGDGSFSDPFPVPTGVSTTAVALGDFNHDGNGDLAATLYFARQVLVFLGNGDRTFNPPNRFPVGDGVLSITVGDLNNDFHEDLVTANFLSSTVSVLLGIGDGSFQSLPSLRVGVWSIDVAVADLNLDGCQDLAVANRTPEGTISAALGVCDGTFQLASLNPVGSWPVAVAAADFDGDTIPDLVSANALSDTVSVLIGLGDGSFKEALTYTSDGSPSPPTAVTAVDANRDGYMDLAVTNANPATVAVLLNDGMWNSSPYGGPGHRNAPDNRVARDVSGFATPFGFSGANGTDSVTTRTTWIALRLRAIHTHAGPSDPVRLQGTHEERPRAQFVNRWQSRVDQHLARSLDNLLRPGSRPGPIWVTEPEA